MNGWWGWDLGILGLVGAWGEQGGRWGEDGERMVGWGKDGMERLGEWLPGWICREERIEGLFCWGV